MKPNFSEEKKAWKKGFNFVAGLDEAGRGPLAGPVVAGVVIINKEFVLNKKGLKDLFGIKDSKQLSEKDREKFYNIITKHSQIKWGVGKASEKIIDQINILNATKLAMTKALKDLAKRFGQRNTAVFLLVDGNMILDNAIDYKSIVNGDQKVFSISAASIIAKVTRDRAMKKYHKKYSEYGFDKHKGYGTKLHIKNIKKFGPCKIHRKTFYPVSSL